MSVDTQKNQGAMISNRAHALTLQLAVEQRTNGTSYAQKEREETSARAKELAMAVVEEVRENEAEATIERVMKDIQSAIAGNESLAYHGLELNIEAVTRSVTRLLPDMYSNSNVIPLPKKAVSAKKAAIG